MSHRRPPSRDELLSTFVFQYTSPAFVFDFASIAACDVLWTGVHRLCLPGEILHSTDFD